MYSPRLRDWLLPLLVLAFVGGSVSFLDSVFNTATRWAVLVTVAAYLLMKGQLLAPFRTSIGVLALAFVSWALATTLWSQVPELSLLKALVFGIVVFCGIGLGQFWASKRSAVRSLEYLYPLMFVAVLAAVGGGMSSTSMVQSGDTVLYQGAVKGPNMFGMLLAMCAPLVVWQLYVHWPNRRRRWIGLAVAACIAYFLVASGARASMLAALCTVLGAVTAFGIRRRAQLLVVTAFICAATYLVAPAETEALVTRLVFKSSDEDLGVLHSREEPWIQTYEAAQQGGWFGIGFGVSAGETSFTTGSTTVGYGREKGNSQLAIVEETGLVGLLIYVAFQCALFFRLISRLRVLPPGHDKVLLGLLTGTLFGLTVQSFFEAWWCSPGSPESVYFWTLCGVCVSMRVARRQQAPQPDRGPALMRLP